MQRSAILRAGLVAALLAPAPATAETLADAIALAYRTNPTIESGRYDVRAADEGIVQARAELRPNASVNVEAGYNRSVLGRASTHANPFTPEASSTNSDTAQLVVTQPLFTGGRATADRQAAEAGVRSAREALRATEGDLLLAVITAYIDVRRYQAVLAVWDSSVADLEKIVAEVTARQQAGELTRTDIAQAQSQLDAAREQAVATRQDLEGARTDYAALVGRNPGPLAPEPPLPQLPGSVDTAFALAEAHNPELGQALQTERASRAEVAVARSAGAPTVALRGSASLTGTAVPFALRNQDQGFAGSVVVTLPLTAGGQVASEIRQAEDRNGSDRFRIEAARRQLVRDVNDAWNQIASAARQVRLLDAQHSAAETQLDGMINEYRLGLRSTFDVLYAEQSLRDVEVALLASQRNRYIAEASLLRRAGLLEARTIMTGVPLDDPARHLRQVVDRNAVPWEGAIAALDRLGPGPKQQRLAQPPVTEERPALARTGQALPAEPAFSTRVPIAPIPGTAGRPVTPPERRVD